MPTPNDILEALTIGYNKHLAKNQSLVGWLTRPALEQMGLTTEEPCITRVKTYLSAKPADSQLTSADALALTNLLQDDLLAVVDAYVQNSREESYTDDALFDVFCFGAKHLSSQLHESCAFHIWYAIMESFALVSPVLVLSDTTTNEEFTNRVIGWEMVLWLYRLDKNHIQVTERSFQSLISLRQIMLDCSSRWRSGALSQEQFTTIEARYTMAPSMSSTAAIGGTVTALPVNATSASSLPLYEREAMSNSIV